MPVYDTHTVSVPADEYTLDVRSRVEGHPRHSRSRADRAAWLSGGMSCIGLLALDLLTMLGVDPSSLSNYGFVWVSGVPTTRDPFERCFQSDVVVERERRRSHRWTA